MMIIFIVVALTVKMYHYDKISTAGNKLKELESKLIQINSENEAYLSSINSESSLKVIHQKSIELGFVEADIIYIDKIQLASLQ